MTRKQISHTCRVVNHQNLGGNILVISLDLELSRFPQAGEFLHIRLGCGNDPLLRRPFSIFDYDQSRGVVDVLYKVVGRGTRLLSEVRVGDALDVLGPLGNGFADAEREANLLLVGGGVGIPPLYLLAKRVCKFSEARSQVSFLCGVADASQKVIAERIEALPVELEYSSDNGTLGHHGLVTDLLERRLESGVVNRNWLVCACGPELMLKAVKRICAEHRLRCYLSLERIMPCGLGTCLGCVVKRTDDEGYYRVCREGPVFSAEGVEL